MLIRLSLIVALLAGLAVGALNFTKVKEKITTLQSDLKRETDAHADFERKFKVTKSELDKTNAVLKQTIATLDATTADKEKAQADLAVAAKKVDKLTDDLTKTRADRDSAQQELAAYKVTGYSPERVASIQKEVKQLQDNLTGAQEENKVLGQNLKKTQNELARYKEPEKFVVLPATLKGKVLITDPKWNFVVLNVGENQGILEYGELLVNRNGKLVAKVVVRTVHKDQCIANVLPGWELGEVMEGDQVIPAHPAS
jgi:septation ring formation regulator EzrA